MDKPPKDIDLGPDEYRVEGQRPSEWWENPPDVSFMSGLLRLGLLVGGFFIFGYAAKFLHFVFSALPLWVNGALLAAIAVATIFYSVSAGGRR